jgi:integrase
MNTFNEVYKTWHNRKLNHWTTESAKVSNCLMINHVIPVIGSKPIDKIKTKMIDELLESMDDKGFVASRKKAYSKIVSVFNLAIRNELIDFNPASAIDTTFYKKATSTPRATTVNPRDIGKILTILNNNYHHLQTWQVTIAFKLLPYLMSRPVEVAGLRWSEVNFEDRVIIIPRERMKSDREHQIPMSDQVFKLLKAAEEHRMNSEYVFPSPRGGGHISTRSLLLRLRRAGIKPNELTSHGWRSMASTRLNEGINSKGSLKPSDNTDTFDYDAIEIQLAHKDTSQRGIYNHSAYFESRREMMQSWADYLDKISA